MRREVIRIAAIADGAARVGEFYHGRKFAFEDFVHADGGGGVNVVIVGIQIGMEIQDLAAEDGVRDLDVLGIGDGKEESSLDRRTNQKDESEQQEKAVEMTHRIHGLWI